MRDLSNEVLCIECRRTFPASEITAKHGEREESLAVLRSGRLGQDLSPKARGRRAAGKLLGKADQVDLGAAIDALQDWAFECPEGHQVDGNSGHTFPVAVIGRSGSSKSHFVPAIPWEVKVLGSLDGLDIGIRDPIWKGPDAPDLQPEIERIFSQKLVAEPTRAADGVRGPFSYRLMVEMGQPSERNLALYLFDAPGEFFDKLEDIANRSPYLLLARSVVLLLDPEGLVSTVGQDSLLSEDQQALAVADAIDLVTRVADAFRQIFNSRGVTIPLCIVLAKADAVDTRYEWSTELSEIIDAEVPLSESLAAASERAKAEFGQLGMSRLVRAVDRQYDPSMVRWVFASATNENAVEGEDGERHWLNPRPQGVGLSVLHLLDMARVVRGSR